MEDEERGGLESEDLSGSILDEDDCGIMPPEDISADEECGGSTAEECGDSIPEEAPGLTSIADEFVSPPWGG